MKPFLLTVCLAFLVLRVQAAAPEDQNDSTIVSVEFTLFGWAGEIQNLAYKQGGRLNRMNIPGYTRSQVYTYTGPARMALYPVRESTKADDPEVGSVTFATGVKRFTVLIAPQGNGYLAKAAADDEEHFPFGRARFFNLCPVRVLVRCNQKNGLVLQPGQMEIVSPRADNILVTETAFDRNGTWQRANDDFVAVPPDAQTSVFFLQSDDNHFKSIDGFSRSLQMVILREKPEDRKKTSEPTLASMR